MKRKHMIINRRNAMLLSLALGTMNALAVDGTWILNGSDNWSNNTSAWSGNQIADGVGATATFTLNLTSNRNFTFNSNRTLGTLNTSATGRSSNFLASGGAILTLDNTGSTNAVVTTASTSGQNHNIAVPIELMDSLDVTNNLTSASGKSVGFNNTITVKSGASNSGNLTITNNATLGGTPMTNFNGLISDGAGSITLVNAAGIMNISNAGNTFSGTTTNTSGIIRIDNAAALQNSALNTSGSITGNATNGLRLNTGITTLTLGGLTGSKNINAAGTGVFSTASSNYNLVTALTLKPIAGKSETYSGAIENGAAAMTLTKSGAGTQTLTGTNLYTGATNVNQGTLAVTGTGSINSSSGVTINGGTFRYNSSTDLTPTVTYTSGTIAGTNWNGSLSGQTIGTGQTISPGNSPGTAATVSQTWAAGGSYLWEINNATGTAGSDPGWDLETGTGTLDISAISGSEFNLLVTSLDILNAAGAATNFVDTNSYNWLIADFNAITGFAANAFNIDTSAFTNTFTGTFGVSLGGVGAVPGDNSQIYLTYTAIPEPGAALLGGLGLLALLRRRRN